MVEQKDAGYVKNVNITMNGGSVGYFTAGGSNGWTDEATLTVKGGNIQVLQGVNRGSTQSVDMTVTGGTIGAMYAGGETTDKGVTGTIQDVDVNILEGANVSKLEIGTSGGKEIVPSEDNITVSLSYDEGTIENFNNEQFEGTIIECVNVTINEEKYRLEKGKTLSDLDLSTLKNVEGKEFFRFYNVDKEEEVSEKVAINENIEVVPEYIEPKYDSKRNSVFCHGVPVTIEARTDGEAGAVVKWNGGEILVNKTACVFGGAHGHSQTLESSKIVMNGGTIKAIWGGGLHISYVKSTNIELNGGTITGALHGGGSESNYNQCHKPRHQFSAGQDASPVRVDNAEIKITGGRSLIVFAGSEGNGNTKNINITVEGGQVDYLVGNGSSGWIDETTIRVKAGTIGVLQGVNRGVSKKVNTIITGGTVETLYVGGETIDNTVTGVIENAVISIVEPAKVKKIEIGTTGGKEIVVGEDNVAIELGFDYGTVENIDVAKFGDTKKEYVYVTIKENRYKLERGQTLSTLDLSAIKNVSGKEFVKFVKKGTMQQITEDTLINETIEIEAVYKDKVVIPPKKFPFTDVKEKDWYYNSIKFVYENGMILGKTDTLFKPNDNLTRGQLVTILWRMEGSKIIEGDTFPDVKSNQYYYNAVKWAVKNRVVNGYSDGTFKPNNDVSRQQLAVILMNYAKFKGKDISKRVDLTKYTDYKKISSYAPDSISWAIASKVMSGKENGTKVDPQGTATRGQIATMLTNYCAYVGK